MPLTSHARSARWLAAALLAAATIAGSQGVGAQTSTPRRALVYCPITNGTTEPGCARIHAVLEVDGLFDVDRGFDGSQGTVDIRSEALDLTQYSLVVVPSLADERNGPTPLSLLRTHAGRFGPVLDAGRVAVFSGSPDKVTASASRPSADRIITNLADWAAQIGQPGIVVFHDNSKQVAAPYDWLVPVAAVAVEADNNSSQMYNGLSAQTALGTSLLSGVANYAGIGTVGLKAPLSAGGSIDAVSGNGKAVLATFRQTAAPVAPSATMAAPTSVTEGSGILLELTPTNVSGSYTYAFDCGNGTFGTAGSANLTTCPTTDDGTRAVRGKITEGLLSSEYVASVEVTNVAPSATLQVPTGSVALLGSFSVSLSDATDPSTDDVAAGFTFAFDCGGGYGDFGTSASATCSAPTAGMRTVKAKIRDKDDGVSEYSGTVDVAPATTSMTVESATGTYGGKTTLSATLAAMTALGEGALAGKTIAFSLNGSVVGTASTNGSGVATLSDVSLASISASTYATGVLATFTQEADYTGATGTGQLTVSPATPTFSGLSSSTIEFGATPTVLSGALKAGDLAATGSVTIKLNGVTQTTSIDATTGQFSSSFATGSLSVGSSPYPVEYHYDATTNFAGATDATTVLTVEQAAGSISITGPSSLVYNTTGAITPTATGDGAISYGVTVGTSVCEVSAAGVVSMKSGTGSCTVQATLAASTNYTGAVSDPLVIAAERAVPAFTFSLASLPPVTFGASPFSLHGDEDDYVATSSTGAVTFALGSGSAGCSVTPTGQVAITGAAVNSEWCIIEASLAQTDNYEAAGPIAQQFHIARATQTVTFTSAVPTDAYYLGASYTPAANGGASGNAITFGASGACSYAGGKVGMTGVGTCTVTADQAGNANYEAAPQATQVFTVDRAPQEIIFAALAGKTYGDADFQVGASASSGLSVTFTSSNMAVCSVSGTTVHILKAGSCTVVASQVGSDLYKPAPPVSQSFTIDRAQPAFTELQEATITYGDESVTLGGTIRAGSMIPSGSVSVTVNGATVPAAIAAGTGAFSATVTTSGFNANVTGYAITYSYAETDNFKSVSDGTKQLIVQRADQVISWGNPANIVYGAALGGTQLNASRTKGDGTLTYDPAAGTVLDAGTHTLKVHAAETTNFNAATETVTLIVDKANAGIVVNGYTGVYDGNAHGATGTATGVRGEDLGSLLNLGAGFTDVPGGTANWSFAGNGNYNVASGSVPITIEPATPTILWGPLAAVPQGTALSGTQLDARVVGVDGTTTVSGSLAYVPPIGSVLVYVNPATELSVGFTSANRNYTNNTKTVTIGVTNVAPTVTIAAPASGSVYQEGAMVTLEGTFVDPGLNDTHEYEWRFESRDNVYTIPATSVNPAPGGRKVSSTFQFPAQGVYNITLTVRDNHGGTGTATKVNDDLPATVVIYDPSAGFVTGGGWINSPAIACRLTTECENSTGKANFGFVSKYQKGARIPTGETQFQYQAGKLNFHSTAYEWLVVSGARAQYKGTGTINGTAGFGFLLTAVDGQVNGGGGSDRFRIKIWRVAGGDVVYDNQMGADDDSPLNTVIGGGSVVIHTGGNGK